MPLAQSPKKPPIYTRVGRKLQEITARITPIFVLIVLFAILSLFDHFFRYMVIFGFMAYLVDTWNLLDIFKVKLAMRKEALKQLKEKEELKDAKD